MTPQEAKDEAARENVRVEDDFTDNFSEPYKSKYPTVEDYLNSK